MTEYLNQSVKIFNDIADGQDGTIMLDFSALPSFGFFVGGVGQPLVFGSAQEANTSQALRRITEFVGSTEALFVGWWTDSADGKVYVDGSEWYPDVDKAQRAAEERGEIAFWDIASASEIRTEG